jgi:hypothetical protein
MLVTRLRPMPAGCNLPAHWTPNSVLGCLCVRWCAWLPAQVQSFGVGSRVKLPGASRTDPNVYQFGVATYEDIYKDLAAKDEALYTRNGLLQMLQRNMAIKRAPQRWQDHRCGPGRTSHAMPCRVHVIVMGQGMAGSILWCWDPSPFLGRCARPCCQAGPRALKWEARVRRRAGLRRSEIPGGCYITHPCCCRPVGRSICAPDTTCS